MSDGLMNEEPALPPALRAATPARVGLGRAGTSLPTSEWLRFSADHAAAREAVHAQWDVAETVERLRAAGIEASAAETLAPDRATYLLRPDLGRRLTPESRALLATDARSRDVVVIMSDGLSATGIQRHGAQLVVDLVNRLEARGLSMGVVVVPLARVGLLDDVGAATGARAAAIVIGERPGLSAPDNLSIYLEVAPRPGLTDADRNCLSNIRPGAFEPEAAADAAAELIDRALLTGVSGTALKALDQDHRLP